MLTWTARGALLTSASAVLYAWSFPPGALRPLAWVALVPLLVAFRRVGARGALVLAWLFVVVTAYVLNDWFPRAVSAYFQQPPVVGFAFFLGVSSLTAAPYYLAFALWYRRCAARPGVLVAPATAAAWVAAELARVKLLGGDPWALLGYSQVGVPWMMQVADVTGVYGISFAVAAVNAALAEWWLGRERSGAGIVAAGLVVALVAGYGAVRLREARPGSVAPVGIAVVQPNLDVGSQWRPELYGENLDAYLRLTQQALDGARPRLVVWPESAMTFFLEAEPPYRRAIARVLAGPGAELLAGGPHEADGAFHNSAFVLAADGAIRARYDKQRLLPFAEYFPARLDFLRRRFGRVREFAAGAPTPPLPTAAGAAGVLICNEAFFPEPAAAHVRAGATYLVNLANDSWLGDPKFSEPAFDLVTLRAVEQRRWLVRASTAGPSGVVDPWGRVTVRTAPFTVDAVGGRVLPRTDVTPYARLGDVFAFACAACAIVAWRQARRT